MNTINKLKIAALSLAITGATSGIANAATTSASMTLDIGTAFSIVKTSDLTFGSILLPGTNGTLVIAPDGTASATGGVLAPGTGASAAGFSVTGPAGNAYTITLPASSIITDGVTNLTVDAYTHDAGTTPTLDGAGEAAFNVGATVNVTAIATVGTYSGTFEVIADY